MATMDQDQPESSTRSFALTLIGAVTAASVCFHLLTRQHLEHTALVFIGIPAILAVAVVLAPKPESAHGVAARTVTLGLLVAGIVFAEGFVCILFASPLFFGVAALITAIVNRQNRRRGGQGARTYGLMLLLLSPAALEGVLPGWETGREESVTVERTVAASPEQVRAALARTPDFRAPLPAFLQLGFPTPGATSGSGLAVGDTRRVWLEHGHHGSGALVMRVAESAPDRVLFTADGDASYVVHWLRWRGAEVRWSAVGDGTTRVRWTLRYRRRLDPSWYFGPVERFGVRTAAGYLIETLATPRPGA
ncbi:MAG TPA: hypothetical protein VFH27_16770 [Longimicrobiaceae bacterium]|nr:hypothetical protein [Longimicrobiaceae bacterium]